ncbi:hypothetical protein ACFFHY_12320 [Levilactobacillus acidifarinae]|nr:hypothetical protein [Levilactobacillus acidifarinae]
MTQMTEHQVPELETLGAASAGPSCGPAGCDLASHQQTTTNH